MGLIYSRKLARFHAISMTIAKIPRDCIIEREGYFRENTKLHAYVDARTAFHFQKQYPGT